MVTIRFAAQVKLGKLPARVDPRTLSLSRYVRPGGAPRAAAGARPVGAGRRVADVRERPRSATALLPQRAT